MKKLTFMMALSISVMSCQKQSVEIEPEIKPLSSISDTEIISTVSGTDIIASEITDEYEKLYVPDQICRQDTFILAKYLYDGTNPLWATVINTVTSEDTTKASVKYLINESTAYLQKVLVTRIGDSNTRIKFDQRTSTGVKFANKTIWVGTPTPSITGPSYSLDWSKSYIFTVNTVNLNNVLEIIKEGAPEVTFTRLDNNRFRLTTPNKPVSTGSIPKVYVLTIKARTISTECGNSEYDFQEIRVGSTTPFE